MKRTIAILLTCIMMLTLAACIHRHKVQHLVYTDDYPTLYESELREIFGDYTLSERVEKHVDGEECGCGWVQDELDYYEWEITYRDACGQPMTCTMNNMRTLSYQQYEWLEDQIGTHFFTGYVERYFDELLWERGSYCFCFLGDFVNSYSNKGEESRMEIGKAYRKNLEQSEDRVPLYALSYRELLAHYPIMLSIFVQLDDETMGERDWEEHFNDAVDRLESMTAAIAEEIGDGLNLEAQVYSRAERVELNRRKAWLYYLRGEQTDGKDPFMFDHTVFESYIGQFWLKDEPAQ
ncbi:MAG: hypothetical protein IJK54_04400 [Clostridia bacterium]|nr:hypothetical protein [Clostridia bacterium]